MAAVAGKRRFQGVCSDLGAVAGQADEFQTMPEEFRRAAFVGGDVGLRVTEHDAPRRRNLRQSQRIGRCAGRHQEDRDLALEDFRKLAFGGLRPIVIAVAAGIATVGLGERVENGGRDARRIVAGEVHCGEGSANCGNGAIIAHCAKGHPMIQLERGTFAKIAVTGGPRSACSSLFFSTRRRRAQEGVGRLYWGAEFAMFCIGQHCCPNW